YLGCMAQGGHGAILSMGCLIPAFLKGMANVLDAGDLPRAQTMQNQLLPLCRAIYAEPNPGPLKYLLRRVGRSAGPTRAPLYEPTDSMRMQLEHVLPTLSDLHDFPQLTSGASA